MEVESIQFVKSEVTTMSNSVSKWFLCLSGPSSAVLGSRRQMARRQDDLSRLVVYQSVTKFVDSVSYEGVYYSDHVQ